MSVADDPPPKTSAPATSAPAQGLAGRWARMTDNDIFWSFVTTPTAMAAAAVAGLAILAAFAAPLIAPFNPFDPSQISLWDGKLPPVWVEGGQSQYLLGTDNQGRDMLSTILYGGRLSIIVGLAAVCLGMVLGVTLGVISGYVGGATDAIIMRIADVQLTIPGILLAILINGIGRAFLPVEVRDEFAIYVVIIAIGLT
ncbi:MAG: ABC transporter permease, partial [Pseudomonadota bacterium]